MGKVGRIWPKFTITQGLCSTITPLFRALIIKMEQWILKLIPNKNNLPANWKFVLATWHYLLRTWGEKLCHIVSFETTMQGSIRYVERQPCVSQSYCDCCSILMYSCLEAAPSCLIAQFGRTSYEMEILMLVLPSCLNNLHIESWKCTIIQIRLNYRDWTRKPCIDNFWWWISLCFFCEYQC